MGGLEIASLFAKVGADASDYDKAMRGVRDNLVSSEKATNKFADVTVAAFKAVTVAAVAVGTAIVAVVSTSVSAAADMEQGIADVGAMMALTADETAQLGDHIMDLGLDPTLKVSATEASAAVMALGTAGASVTDIMGGMSEATVLLANATGLKGEGGFAASATIASDVMAQFNITAGEMDKAVNQIAGTTVASKFSIDDYRLAIAQAGGVASAVGVPFEDFNAAIAATSSSFASGSDAGTSFKTFLQRLAPDTEPAKIALKELGLMAADGSAKFFDASGNLKSMEEIAGLLQGAFGGLSDAQRIQTASTLFGTDAMRTALSLADGGTAIITKMKGEIGKVDAEELAAKRMNTFKGAMEIAQGVIETISISIGNKFLPVLRPLVEKFTELAQTYGPAVIGFFGSLADGIAGILTPISDMSQGTGGLFENLKGLWTTLQNVTETVKLAIKPVTDAIAKYVSWKDVLGALGILLAGPVLGAIWAVIGAITSFLVPILALTAAVAALRFAWEQDFIGIRTFTLSTLQKLSDWFYKESGIWKGTWEDTFEFIAKRVNKFFRIDIYNFIVGTWAEIKFQWWFRTTQIRDLTEAWINSLIDKVAHWKSVAIELFNQTKDRILGIFQDTFGVAIREVGEWYRRTKDDIERWKDWGLKWFGEWRDTVLGWFGDVLDWWDTHINPLIQTGKDIVGGLREGMEWAWDRFMIWWNGVWGKDLTKTVEVKMQTHSPSKVMEGLGINVVEGFAIGAENTLPRVFSVMDRLVTGVTERVTGAADGVKDAMAAIGQVNPYSTLQGALGQGKAKGIFEAASTFATLSFEALKQGNVAEGNQAYFAADMVKKLDPSTSLKDFKDNIDNLMAQLGDKGVASYAKGKAATTGLGQLSDYLGALMAGNPNAESFLPTPEPDASTQMTTAILAVLKAILVELQKSGTISERGFSQLVNVIGGARVRDSDLPATVISANGLRG